MEGIFIIGATNRPELIDEALLRPGRFDYQVCVPLSDEEDREEIFKIHFKKEMIGKDVKIKELIKKTEGFSGAEIAEVCRLAGLKALRAVNFERATSINSSHLFAAIEERRQKKASLVSGNVMLFQILKRLREPLMKIKDSLVAVLVEKRTLEKSNSQKSMIKQLLYPLICLCLVITILTGIYFYFLTSFLYYWLTPGVFVLALNV